MKYTLLIFFFFCFTWLPAQQSPYALINQVPSTPSVATIEKFANLPVGTYTGIPAISIPIYTIQAKGLSLPIDLSYHAGGIRLNEVASWVGLGWNINSGPSITRVVQGIPDEHAGGYLLYNGEEIKMNDITGNSLEMIMQLAGKQNDMESDIYTVNIPTGSHKFYFDKQGKAYFFKHTNAHIEHDLLLQLWIITDENGIKYFFENDGISSQISNVVENAGYSFSGNAAPQIVNSCWNITKIVTPQADTITFHYQDQTIPFYEASRSESRSFLQNVIRINANSSIAGRRPYFSNTSSFVRIHEKYLTEIRYQKTSIKFNLDINIRKDLLGSGLLKSIKIMDNNLLKRETKLNFKYATVNSLVELDNANSYDAAQLRLLLMSVQNFGSDGIASTTPYMFSYYRAHPWEARNSYAVDLWGYFNGQIGNTGLLPPVFNGSELYADGANKSVNPEYAQIGTLSSIQYPTGGKTLFTYESNSIPSASVPSDADMYVLTNTHTDLTVIPPTLQLPNPITGTIIVSEKTFSVADPSDFRRPGFISLHNLPYKLTSDFTCPISFEVINQNGQIILNNESFIGNCAMTQNALGNNKYIYNYVWTSLVYPNLPAGQYTLRHKILGPQETSTVYDPYLLYIPYYLRVTFKKKVLTSSASTPGNVLVGGLRIKKIENYTAEGSLALSKSYDYSTGNTTNGVSSGSILNIPNYKWENYDDYTYQAQSGSYTYIYQEKIKYLTLFSDSRLPLSTTQGAYVGYATVKEVDTDEGMIKYTFTNPSSHPDFVNSYPVNIASQTLVGDPKFKLTSSEWARGLLLSKEIYKQNNILIKIQNYYSFYTYDSIAMANSIPYVKVEKIVNPFPLTFQGVESLRPDLTESYQLYSFEKYTNKTSHTNLDSTVEHYYGGNAGANLKKNTTYLYNRSLYPKEVITDDFRKGTLVTKLIYATDFNVATLNSSSFAGGIKTLLNNKMPATIIEKSQFVKDANNVSKVVSSLVNEYYPDKPFTKSIYRLDVSSITSNFSPMQLIDGNITIDNKYSIQNSFNYDERRNIVEQQKTDDVKEVYLWGYNGRYPVAKVIGSDYSTVSAAVTQTVLDNGTDAQIDAQLTSLRSTFSSSPLVQVFTYTYKPLVGMTSETAPNGKTTYYEYDSFNRLHLIKDDEGNIVKRICYNYAGQVEDCGIGLNTNAQWVSTGLTRCQPCPANNSYTSNVQEDQEKDNNPNSPTYNTYRWVSDGVNSNCTPLADWQNTVTAIRCKKDGSNQNTGEQEREQRDMNPCSSTYNQLRWVVTGTNQTACPIPYVCTTGNCWLEGYKCVFGNCELGIRVCISSSYDLLSGLYENTYRYEWSDGSWSGNFVETAHFACAFTEM